MYDLSAPWVDHKVIQSLGPACQEPASFWRSCFLNEGESAVEERDRVIYPLAEVLNLYCAFLFIVHSSTENILGKGS